MKKGAYKIRIFLKIQKDDCVSKLVNNIKRERLL